MSEYPAVDFLFLNEDDMVKAGVTDMHGCVDAMEEVLKLLDLGDFMMGGENHYSHGTKLAFPAESPFPEMPSGKGEDRRFMAMPAYIGAPFDNAGVKWYGSNMENKKKGLPRSILMFTLTDKDTGAPKAFMSANLLSAYRTGATAGAGLRHLAKKDSKIAGICGPGVIGRTTFEAIMDACPEIELVKIKGRSQKGIDEFTEFAKEKYPNVKVESVPTLEECVRDSDVVGFAATSGHDLSKYPKVEKEWVKPGATIACPGGVEFDKDFLVNDCTLAVDALGLYKAWASEFPYPTYGNVTMVGTKFMDMEHEGMITDDDIKDVGKIINGKQKGREKDDEIIIYSVGGMPVEDVAWATVCYEKAVKEGIGTKLHLWDKPLMC
ncbi:MAG: tyramine oxidase subunit B [Lachnospiraceae bacterium]|nr:tyramine oxidase subunit B [Lachnospiraceae bacterium]